MGVRLRFLFPSLKNLSAYYTYAHRYPLLLPIAWQVLGDVRIILVFKK